MSKLPLVAGGLNPFAGRKIERVSKDWSDTLDKAHMLAAETILSKEQAAAKARGDAAAESRREMQKSSKIEIEKQLAALKPSAGASVMSRFAGVVGREFEKNKAKKVAEAARGAEAAKSKAAEAKAGSRSFKIEAEKTRERLRKLGIL